MELMKIYRTRRIRMTRLNFKNQKGSRNLKTSFPPKKVAARELFFWGCKQQKTPLTHTLLVLLLMFNKSERNNKFLQLNLLLLPLIMHWWWWWCNVGIIYWKTDFIIFSPTVTEFANRVVNPPMPIEAQWSMQRTHAPGSAKSRYHNRTKNS